MEYAAWYPAKDGQEQWLVDDSEKLLDTHPADEDPISVTNVPGTVIGIRFRTGMSRQDEAPEC